MIRQLATFRANCWTLKLYIDKGLVALDALKIDIKTGNGDEEKELAGRRPIRKRCPHWIVVACKKKIK